MAKDIQVEVDVQIAAEVSSVPGSDIINDWIAAALEKVDPGLECEVCVRVVDEDEGRALNREYRDKDYATNVLSFGADTTASRMVSDIPTTLGDIVICGPIVEREASAQKKLVANHWGHLLVHGMLHLLGHDHEQDHDAAVMEALETEILTGKGLPDPYND